MRIASLALASLISATSIAASEAAPRLKLGIHESYSDQQRLRQDTELNMIRVQQLVSQRQMTVQMTTNMVRTMNEASRQVVKNIGSDCHPNC